jgi:hypothetical protein
VAGDMIATDPWAVGGLRRLPINTDRLVVGCEAGMAILVLLAGWIIQSRRKSKRRKESEAVRVS